jgi:hypothetical protein
LPDNAVAAQLLLAKRDVEEKPAGRPALLSKFERGTALESVKAWPGRAIIFVLTLGILLGTKSPARVVFFEILPAEWSGTSLIPPKAY